MQAFVICVMENGRSRDKVTNEINFVYGNYAFGELTSPRAPCVNYCYLFWVYVKFTLRVIILNVSQLKKQFDLHVHKFFQQHC